MKFLRMAITIIIITSAYACSSNITSTLDPMQESFLDLISIENMNNSLRIEVTNDKHDEYKFESVVDILIENVSDQEIFLPADSSVLRTFVSKNNNWVEVKNNVIYYGDGSTLHSKGSDETEWLTGVLPMLEPGLGDIVTQASVCILVVGEFMSNGQKTGIPVAAYVDLVMKRQ